MFSETTNWAGVTAPTDMTVALGNLVETSLKAYINLNFQASDNYLGGFSSLTGYTPPANVSKNGTYDCDQLHQVWIAAKCQDIANDSTSNSKTNTSASTGFFFLSASTYGSQDYRKYPTSAQCTLATAWTGQLSLASNAATQYPKETYNAYTAYFAPTTCAGPGLPIIPTGVTVTYTGTPAKNHPEIICVAPGCASDVTGTKCCSSFTAAGVCNP